MGRCVLGALPPEGPTMPPGLTSMRFQTTSYALPLPRRLYQEHRRERPWRRIGRSSSMIAVGSVYMDRMLRSEV